MGQEQSGEQNIYETEEPQRNKIPDSYERNPYGKNGINSNNKRQRQYDNNDSQELQQQQQQQQFQQQQQQFQQQQQLQQQQQQQQQFLKPPQDGNNNNKGPQDSITYSTEIHVHKKVKTNDQQDINLRIFFSKDINNIVIPEKWGNQSASLKSSIELLGSVSLKNYEKSEILQKLAFSNENSSKLSIEEQKVQQQYAQKLNQVSHLLQSFGEDQVKLYSVSCNLFDQNSKQLYTCLKLSASTQAVQVLSKGLNSISKSSRITNSCPNKYGAKQMSGNYSQTTGLQSTNFSSNNQNQTNAQNFMGECFDSGDEEEDEEYKKKNQNSASMQQSENFCASGDVQDYQCY